MRKLLWAVFLFGAYIWAIQSGHDQTIIHYGKQVYESLTAWLEDAEVDFQLSETKKKEEKKKSKKW